MIISTCNRVEIYTAHDVPGSGPELRQLAQFCRSSMMCRSMTSTPIWKRSPEPTPCGTCGSRQQHRQHGARRNSDRQSGQKRLRRSRPGDCLRTADEYSVPASLAVSGRVRTETRLSEGRISIASVAVIDSAKASSTSFADKTVLVIGAGEMGEETLRYLKTEGVKRILVCKPQPRACDATGPRVWRDRP